MSMVGFPLLLIPLAIYNIIVFLMPGVSLAEPLVTLPLITSGAQWPVTLSDVLVALGILMLLFEVIKGARPGAKYFTDHLLSFIVFGGAVAEFLLWPRFATSAFFLLTLLAMVDFLSGVTLRVRRGSPATGVSGRASRRSPAEVRQEPSDLPPVAPTPINEPAAPAPSGPSFGPPETAAVAAAPEVHPPHADGVSPPHQTQR